ncbi:MBL fold metallo-hydrolase [bacterium]|nr:MBL fold metallo-hydrolase [bacterium]MBU4510389.1 MBL fold metallo-hydrolase [bacterium]
MSNNQNNINNLIEKANSASLQFETIMDSIDFNSYLLEDQKNGEVKDNPLYKNYIGMVEKASNICKDIIQDIPSNITKINVPNPEKQKEMEYYLIYHLFKAKRIRIIVKQQIEREKEKKYYIISTHNLHKAFNHIPKKYFYCSQKGKNLLKSYNWAKVLFYNELAICYSGLAKSSMSLGYAEESISLLEELYSKLKNLENPAAEDKKKILLPSDIIKLYTFALLNKGEAEKLLNEVDSALRTFRRIVEIYKKSKKKRFNASLSDCNFALLREASILIDQGRGQEAIICLESDELKKLDPLKDYRAQYRDLEKASALIDQKKYKDAWNLLVIYTVASWDYTFTQRQAKIHQLRLMNEFRENRPEDFQATHKLMKFSDWQKLDDFAGINYDEKAKNITLTLMLKLKDNIVDIVNVEEDKKVIEALWQKLHLDNNTSKEIKAIKEKYPEFESMAKDLIKKASERKDGDSFKGACTKLAEFYQLKNAEKQKKDFEKALIYFHLYLFESKIFSDKQDEINNIIKNWLENNVLDFLLQDYKDAKNTFPQNLKNNDDENYLRNFFDVYIDHFIENKNTPTPSKDQMKTIKKLKERLDYIYQQKDKDSDLEQIRVDFDRFTEKLKEDSDVKKEPKIKKFIENYFFKKTKVGMRGESIASQMERNTEEFIKNIVGRSKIPVESNGEMQGTLSVLRRWNSFTPTLSSSINQSKGGGYFLRFAYNNESFGIVIDPGYNYLENFFSQGFKIGDIDLVLVSHAHPDHTDNLAAILSLFHEMNGKLGKYHYQKEVNKKNLTLVLSHGVFKHYNSIINSSEDVAKILKDIIVINGKDDKLEKVFEDSHITIEAFGTAHQDLSQFQSLGFIITVKKNDKHKAVIGYTGDIKWSPNKTNPPKYLKHFEKCDIICAHLGSIINILNEKNFCNTFCRKSPDDDSRCPKYNECKKNKFKSVDVTEKKLIEQTREEKHLYLAGLTLFFNTLLKEKDNKLKLAIISEFGEELKNGIRKDLYMKFDSWFKKAKKKLRCLPGDIGLEVDVFTGNVYCHCCKRFVDRAGIKPVAYGKEEALCFVCNECEAVLSSYQIGHVLKDYCENGRNLESAEPTTGRGSR